MTTHAELIRDIKRFLSKHKMRESRFGRDALGDPKFIYELFDGKRSPQLRTVARVQAFMKAYQDG